MPKETKKNWVDFYCYPVHMIARDDDVKIRTLTLRSTVDPRCCDKKVKY